MVDGYYGVTDLHGNRCLIAIEDNKSRQITEHDWGGERIDGVRAIADMIEDRTKNRKLSTDLARQYYDVWLVAKDFNRGTWSMSFDQVDAAVRALSWDLVEEAAEASESDLARSFAA